MIITPNEIRKKLSEPLPGLVSHLKLAPIERIPELKNYNYVKPNAKKSAVMILLFEEENRQKAILIRRSMYVGIHADQVAFPGGRYEEFDLNLEATALREVNEEIGIEPSSIELLGRLSDIFVSKSNFIISTFVGFLKNKPVYKKDEREVADIYELDLESFFDENIIFEKNFVVPSAQDSVQAMYYKIGDVDIWGASAMIMSEFIDVISTDKNN